MPRMPWFRMHCEARSDNKLRALADDEFRVWFNLLCLAAEQDDRGIIPAMDPYLLATEVAGGDEGLLERTITKLSRLRVISRTGDGSLSFINFDKRNYDHPSDHRRRVAERVRRHRTRPAGDGNDDVTTCNDDVTTCNDIDRDRDRERERVNPPVSPLAADAATGDASAKTIPPVQAKPAKRATAVPDDFTVTAEMRATAAGYGVPPEAIDYETEKFLDHFRAKGERKLDWAAAWRNWMRRAAEMMRQPPARASPKDAGSGLSGRDAAARAKLDALLQIARGEE